jgi:small subunit ribosomal protein S20
MYLLISYPYQMPITSSAKKALKRDLVLTERNAYFKIAMKRAIKALRKGVASKVEKTELQQLLVQAYQAIDKAARRNIVHTNNAARKKSRLTKMINTIA